MKIKLLLLIVFPMFICSCGWLTCESDCRDSFDFTLTYSIPDAKDTLQVGDTLTLIHEMPFVMQENDNGVFYDIEGIPYRAVFFINKLSQAQLKFELMDPLAIEMLETGMGEIWLNVLSDGVIAYNFDFEILDDRNLLEVKIVLHETGEYFFNFWYLDDELWSINIPNLDTCCLGESVLLDYHFEEQIPTHFEKDSFWVDLDGREKNMYKEYERYDPYTFVVVE